jgi:hypothetical protein
MATLLVKNIAVEFRHLAVDELLLSHQTVMDRIYDQ